MRIGGSANHVSAVAGMPKKPACEIPRVPSWRRRDDLVPRSQTGRRGHSTQSTWQTPWPATPGRGQQSS